MSGIENPSTVKIRKRVMAKLDNSMDRPVDIVKATTDTMLWIPKEDPIAVFLSAGIDSHICLFACMELGLNVSVTSFTLEGHESTDFKAAKHAAEEFGLDFHPVYIKTDTEYLKRWVKFAVHKLGMRSKPEIECSLPLYLSIKQLAGEFKHITLGLGSDLYFLMGKTATMHFKDRVAEYRRAAFRLVPAQELMVKREAFKRGMCTHYPFYDLGRVYVEMQTSTNYKELNTPQKAVLHNAWPEWRARSKVRPHQNFQLGDTGISSIFSEKLLPSDWNVRGLKSVKGIYNDVISGKL